MTNVEDDHSFAAILRRIPEHQIGISSGYSRFTEGLGIKGIPLTGFGRNQHPSNLGGEMPYVIQLLPDALELEVIKSALRELADMSNDPHQKDIAMGILAEIHVKERGNRKKIK